jgi:hypothetical protein
VVLAVVVLAVVLAAAVAGVALQVTDLRTRFADSLLSCGTGPIIRRPHEEGSRRRLGTLPTARGSPSTRRMPTPDADG